MRYSGQNALESKEQNVKADTVLVSSVEKNRLRHIITHCITQKDMSTGITFRCPSINDGVRMHALAKATGVLSVNSTYAYTMMACHFSQTCLLAEQGEHLAGYVMGYFKPGTPDTLFVWQVGVALEYQGQGIGRQLLITLIERCTPNFLESTITRENTPSINVFSSTASHFQAEKYFSPTPFFSSTALGAGEPAEHLMRIGPLL